MNPDLRRQIQDLERLAFTDGLLDLPNRRAFEKRLREEWARTQRYGRTFAVALVDIDGLKQINDDHGHQAGDSALRFVAGVLRAELREVDYLARWGGDELVALMPNTDRPQAETSLQRIQVLLDTVRHAGPDPSASFSFGVADGDAAGDEAGLVAAADARMYQSKARRAPLGRAGGRSIRPGRLADPLRVLIVESQEPEVQLTLHELRKGGSQLYFESTADAASTEAALRRPWDLVLCEWCLPQLEAVQILDLLSRCGAGVPFVFLSSIMSDDAIATALHAGAFACIRKTEMSVTLRPAVELALAQAGGMRSMHV